MKAIRIFLLILIIIGIGLLATQKIWVPKLVDKILEKEKLEAPLPNAIAGDTEIEEAIATVKKDHAYAPLFKIIYIDKENGRIWFNPPLEGEGCLELTFYDVKTKQYMTLDSYVSGCSQIDFVLSKPFYIEYCYSYAPFCLTDFKNLYATNLETLDRQIIFPSADKKLNSGETLKSGCGEGDYGQVCNANISLDNDKILKIGVYKDEKHAETTFENLKLRDEVIDLKSLTF